MTKQVQQTEDEHSVIHKALLYSGEQNTRRKNFFYFNLHQKPCEVASLRTHRIQ